MKEALSVEFLIVAAGEKGLEESAKDAVGLALMMGANPENAMMLVIGEDCRTAAESASVKFGLPVLALSGANLVPAISDAFIFAIAQVAARVSPRFILMAHTISNMDAAPLLAAKLNAACITGVTGVEEGDSGPVFVRPASCGKLVQRFAVTADCAVVTALPGSFPVPETPPFPPGQISGEDAKTPDSKMRLVSELAPASADMGLCAADVVVAAGRGIGCPENLELIERMATLFPRSAVAGSRPVCDAGWLPANRQVGVTGATVTPKLYIACGISGVFQHVAGMAGSNLIVAINSDPCAPIFSVAHIGVAEDLTAFIPAFLEEAEKARGEGLGSRQQ